MLRKSLKDGRPFRHDGCHSCQVPARMYLFSEDSHSLLASGGMRSGDSAPKTLFEYELHQDQEMYDRACQYIREYSSNIAAGKS